MVFWPFEKPAAISTIWAATYLAPVKWNANGWRRSARGYGRLLVTTLTLPIVPLKQVPARDDFASEKPALCWNFLRNPDAASWSLKQKPGSLTLTGNTNTLDEAASPAFVGRRQQHFNCTATVSLDFIPATENEIAGITVLMNEKHHYDVYIQQEGKERYIVLRYRIGSLTHIEKKDRLPSELFS
jgi:alpha-N-arabinofuranosidase